MICKTIHKIKVSTATVVYYTIQWSSMCIHDIIHIAHVVCHGLPVWRFVRINRHILILSMHSSSCAACIYYYYCSIYSLRREEVYCGRLSILPVVLIPFLCYYTNSGGALLRYLLCGILLLEQSYYCILGVVV